MRPPDPDGRPRSTGTSLELNDACMSRGNRRIHGCRLSDIEAGPLACVRLGGPLLFGRLWERLGLGEVVNDLLDGRGFEFALERAVFVSVLHRLFVSGSDRSCEKWMCVAGGPAGDSGQVLRLWVVFVVPTICHL